LIDSARPQKRGSIPKNGFIGLNQAVKRGTMWHLEETEKLGGRRAKRRHRTTVLRLKPINQERWTTQQKKERIIPEIKSMLIISTQYGVRLQNHKKITLSRSDKRRPGKYLRKASSSNLMLYEQVEGMGEKKEGKRGGGSLAPSYQKNATPPAKRGASSSRKVRAPTHKGTTAKPRDRERQSLLGETSTRRKERQAKKKDLKGRRQ